MDRLGRRGNLRLTPVLRPFDGTLYRAIHPRSGFEPLTGRWSARWGGRFDRVGREALYTSLSPLNSMREVVRSGRMQPTLIVAMEARLTDIVDATASELSEHLLSAPMWREGQIRGEIAAPQQLSEDLIAQGARGLLVRSLVPGAGPLEMNLVLWSWDLDSLRVIDDERRLAPS